VISLRRAAGPAYHEAFYRRTGRKVHRRKRLER
jgi:hypothetical protein